MNVMKTALAASVALLMAGCGGGGSEAGTSFESNGSGDSAQAISEVSNAKATQSRMSLSISDYQLNWGTDGETAEVTVQVADTAGNPLTQATKVQFSASAGIIQSSCTIPAGENGCTVTMSTNALGDRSVGGLAAITAWMVGEEAYIDNNGDLVADATDGNGRWDPGEPFYETGKIYRDDDVSGGFSGADELIVDNTYSDRLIGIGTSTCVQDSAAEPLLVPNSLQGTCDGVWGKTLIRAERYVATSRSSGVRVEAATEDNEGDALSGTWVRVYTLALDGTSKVAAVTGTTVSVTTTVDGCSPEVSPADVPSNAVLPTYHRVVSDAAECAGGTATVKVASNGFERQVNVVMSAP